MPDILIEGGEVLANLDDRTLTGLLLPYGEEGRTNVGRFSVMAGDITIPEDPSVVSLNNDHDRFQPIGRATRLWETAAGIMATFAIGRTAAGDRALTDETRRCLSAEFKTGIKNGRATGGVLAAAAKVARGAFPSAQVLAADAELDDDAVTSEDHSETVYTDEDGKTYRRVYDSVTTEQQTDDGTETTISTTITETETDEAPADQVETEEESEVTATAVPQTQRDSAPATTSDRPADLQSIFAAFAEVKSNPHAADAIGVLAALSDIKISGTGALPVGGNVIRENWVGQLYQGIPYERQFITLGTLGTSITAGGKKGYTLGRGTAASPVDSFDGTWAGNKAAIPSGVGFTASKASELFRFAFGVDIAREFFDLPGGAEVVEAFLRLVVEDHLVWSDEIARQTWVATAGAPIAAGTYPGVDGHDYGSALGMLIQGILAVKAKKADNRRDQPTFAIANELAYEQLIYTPKDLVPEFVNFTASTDSTGTADGLRVVVGDTGIEDTPSVIVGSGKAVEFDELAGGPLHIDALDLARGGVDKAIHGYLQRFVVRPEAVVHIGTADAAGE